MNPLAQAKLSHSPTESTQPTAEAAHSLTHAKSVLISPPDLAVDHLFPPYTKEKVQGLDQWFDY